MISKVLQFADEHEMLSPGDTVLVCVSGGADSMCLLEVIRHISYQMGLNIAAAHYNHMLRGEESDRDETFVMNVCEVHGIPLYCSGRDVKAYAKEHGMCIEEAARDARYGFFRQAAQRIGADKIATAHTMNDNAETMIMNLIRGSGTNGMSSIAPVRDEVIRPLLCVTRDEVTSFLTDRGISYVEDSTNNLDIYTRNNIRRNIIPLFEQFNPRFIEAAFSASELFRADEELISEIADLFIKDCCAGLTANAGDLAVLPFAVSSRVIRKFYGSRTLTHNHVKDVLRLCLSDNPSGSISLPGMIVYREYDRIVFSSDTDFADMEFAPVYPAAGDDIILLALGLRVACARVKCDEKRLKSNINKPFTTFIFKSVDICGRITVRPRREGDCIKLKGHNLTKTLKKLFIEKRVPVRKRPLIPIICDDEGVLGIYGMGVSDRAVPAIGDEAIEIIFKEI